MLDRTRSIREAFLCRLAGEESRGYIADNFAKYAGSDFLARFLMRYELFKRVLGVHGSVVECGVKSGAGLLQWYHISKLIEPLNRRRVVYGFDTFDGLLGVDPTKDGAKARDGAGRVFPENVDPQMGSPQIAYDELLRCISMAQDGMMVMEAADDKIAMQRYGFQHVVPVMGDFMSTGEEFLAVNPHVIVAMLYLDFDLYAPTKKAIELFLPRMPKGAIMAFDEIDHPDWPGETAALMETIGVRNLRIERLPWIPTMGYAVL